MVTWRGCCGLGFGCMVAGDLIADMTKEQEQAFQVLRWWSLFGSKRFCNCCRYQILLFVWQELGSTIL